MKLRIVDIAAALAAACALAVPVLIGGSPEAVLQSLVAPNGTAVETVRARTADVVGEKARSSKRAQPARRRAVPRRVRSERPEPVRRSASPAPKPRPAVPIPAGQEPAETRTRPSPSPPKRPPPAAVTPPPPAPAPPPPTPPPANPPPAAPPPSPAPVPPPAVAAPAAPTSPAAPPEPPRTTQGRDDDDDDEDERDEDEEEEDHEDDEECEDEDEHHGKKKSWPDDDSEGNEVHFPTTEPLPDVLTQLGIEFQNNGRQLTLSDFLRLVAEQLGQRQLRFEGENEPDWPEAPAP